MKKVITMPVLGSFLIRFRNQPVIHVSKGLFEAFLRWLEGKGYLVYRDGEVIIARSRGELLVIEVNRVIKDIEYGFQVEEATLEDTKPVYFDGYEYPLIAGEDIADTNISRYSDGIIKVKIKIPLVYVCDFRYVCMVDVVDTFKPSFEIFKKLKGMGVPLSVNLVRPM